MMKRLRFLILTILVGALSIGGLVGCRDNRAQLTEKQVVVNEQVKRDKDKEEASNIKTKPKEEQEDQNTEDVDDDEEYLEHEVVVNRKYVIIDAGHQRYPISEHEPIGPNSKQTKPKLSSGTEGIVTGVPEYQLTLDVSLKLRDELERKGYEVIMIREDNNCPLSNKERADIANKYEGLHSAFIRLHANSVDDTSISGVLTMCPAKNNPYTPEIVVDSRRLSEDILEKLTEKTLARDMGIIETNSMSGINWSKVPVTIVEMGFMSNPDEDKRLQTEAYQNLIVEGIREGLDEYFLFN